MRGGSGLAPTIEERALIAARAADDKRGSNVLILDLRGLSSVTDYFVIVDAQTEVQVRAVTDGVAEALAEHGVSPLRKEGWADARWVLLDYGDVVVHIFRTEEREYYDLERLWGDAPRFVLSEDQSKLAPAER